jgi:hypothetical protein
MWLNHKIDTSPIVKQKPKRLTRIRPAEALQEKSSRKGKEREVVAIDEDVDHSSDINIEGSTHIYLTESTIHFDNDAEEVPDDAEDDDKDRVDPMLPSGVDTTLDIQTAPTMIDMVAPGPNDVESAHETFDEDLSPHSTWSNAPTVPLTPPKEQNLEHRISRMAMSNSKHSHRGHIKLSDSRTHTFCIRS